MTAMSDEPRTDSRKRGAHCVALVVMVSLLIACVAGDRPGETPFQRAAKRLRVGMRRDEAFSALAIGRSCGGFGDLRFAIESWGDELGNELLWLRFETVKTGSGHRESRLTRWGQPSDPIR
jgi:hypothetical protein